MTRRDRDSIHTLWDQLADFPSSQTDAALAHLFQEVAALVQADDGFWSAAVRVLRGDFAQRDHDHGWRMQAAESWRPGPATPRRHRTLRRNPAHPGHLASGLTTASLTRDAGRFRVRRLHEAGWLDLAAFRRTAHYEAFYREPRVGDRLWVVFPVSGDLESYFCFDKLAARARFSAADARRAAYALRGIKWFHRQLVLSHGLLAGREPLTAAERRVARLLLTGRPEKEIAHTLGLGFCTTHDHVAAIYRKFAVRSRAELMALWLGAR